MKDKPFIVKIQVSLFTTENTPQVLIYNEDHTIEQEFAAPKELLELLDGQPKSYWIARWNKGQVLKLISETDWQDW